MKCKKCGFEFEEGIFCPECGERNAETPFREKTVEEQEKILKKQEEILEQEQKKLMLEKEIKEQEERAKKEEQEKLRIEKEAMSAKANLEQIKHEQDLAEEKRRTYAGVTYRTEEEAITAREDNEKIDLLKERLLNTRKQTTRKEIFDNFNDVIINPVAKQRLEFLREKVNKKMPIGVLLGWIFDAITVAGGIILFILVCICACVAPEADFSIVIMGIWMLFAIFTTPIAVIWTIISLVIMSRNGYYKRIKHI